MARVADRAGAQHASEKAGVAAQHGGRGAPAAKKVEALQRLRAKWQAFMTHESRVRRMTAALAPQPPQPALSSPGDRAFALASDMPFVQPEVISSVNGVLTTTLEVKYGDNMIGSDPVHLRSYNGKLVGPTLAIKPGDTLRITLKNSLPPEPDATDDHNTLHSFSTTNLHTHGLHVSPVGNSDNVLLEIAPGQTQEYEIKVPTDHPAGTFWYHAHHHGSTAANVGSGMSGALIVQGGLDTVAGIAGRVDRVLVLQQIPYYNKDLPAGVIEEEYADQLFGPGDWQALGRFTTVNGVKLPVIQMTPGEIQRWRLIDSGFRERITLQLQLAKADQGTPPSILPLNEIASDGLPLGRIKSSDVVTLWPGYRSDVLVKAPNTPGAEYLLIDLPTAPDESLNGTAEDRKHIARLVIKGDVDPTPGHLPTNDVLKPWRLPSIDPSTVNGQQTATYGILTSSGLQFTIDGKPFSDDNVRSLKLNNVDEWTVTSHNQVGPVSHPFHIHVNPFEVFSILNAQGVETLNEPTWKDTIILNEGWLVKFRTRYIEFTGKFVQHCHILDHEDQGMMQLIEIVP
jgi:FtsP/CotA-like multicopper oxidase with cupredoxin domain